jgi:phage shock protein PspC (stress-responsive transcriptional regulator)
MTESGSSRPKLRRIKGKHWLGGVSAGFGYWFGVPTWVVRLVWTVLSSFVGWKDHYVLLWIFMPEWDTVPADYEERAGG